MRVAGHTYAYRNAPLPAALDALSDLGFELVEVWLGHMSDGPDAVAAELSHRRLEAVAVSAGGYFRETDTSLRAAVELARRLGAPTVVSCIAPRLLDAAARTYEQPPVLCIENHWDQPLAGARELGHAIDGLPFKVCLDTGHAILAGENPVRFASRLGPAIGHVHLKEARQPPLPVRLLGRRARRRLLARPAPVFPGSGSLDVPRLRAALAKARYDGVVTLEHEGPRPSEALAALLTSWELSELGGDQPE